MSRTANPLAAYLDAATDAHNAGVCDADVALLQEIGEDFAKFADGLAAKLARLSDGRMVTRWVGSPVGGGHERREAQDFAAENLMVETLEALSHLDAIDVIRSAADLYLSRNALAEPAREAA